MTLNFNFKYNLFVKAIPYLAWKLGITAFCVSYDMSSHRYFMLSMVAIDILVVSWVISKVIKENIISMHISSSGKEAYLSNKNMALLTENIHHEVKTPLVVIQSKVEHLETMYSLLKKEIIDPRKRTMDSILMSCNPSECQNSHDENACKACLSTSKTHAEETFDMIHLHIGAIHNVLDRMQNFKQIKHSNGNKSLYDIIQASFTTLKLYSKQSFTSIVDPELKKHHVTHLKNERQARLPFLVIRILSFRLT